MTKKGIRSAIIGLMNLEGSNSKSRTSENKKTNYLVK